jgi:beta-lactam-binding protein with PASTA domain
VPNTSFSDPPRRIEVGRQVTVPSVAGLGIAAAIRKFERAGFTVETQFVYSDTVPPFGFMGWAPSPGQSISEFGTIYLVRSKGKDPAIAAAEAAKRKAAADAQKQAEQQQQKQQEQKKKDRRRKHP